MKIGIVNWVEDARRSADSDTIAFPYAGSDAWIHRMEGYVSEFDTGCGGRRLERGCVARYAVRIGVDDARSNLVGMKRGPTNARSPYFREGRGRREHRRPRRKNTIDTEI